MWSAQIGAWSQDPTKHEKKRKTLLGNKEPPKQDRMSKARRILLFLHSHSGKWFEIPASWLENDINQ